jgi:uncharacterized cupredoxin-like copper-binding protein
MNRHHERSEGSVVVSLLATCFLLAVAIATSNRSVVSLHAGIPADTTVTIKAATSTLEFEPGLISAKAGTKLRLVFVNSGTLPHNFVLAKTEEDIDDLAPAAMQAGGDYVPLNMKDKMLAYTKLASPGDTVEVTFTVPPAGTYTFVCLMSGHATMMVGKLRSLR